jgi:hypothetical protein
MINPDEFQSIRAYGERPDITLEYHGNYFLITFERNSLIFKVEVVPYVLEWYVEISDPKSGLNFSDWADYVGYDQRSRNELIADMEDHLDRLLKALLSGTFRLSKGRTRLHPSDHCEWLKDGKWVRFNYGDT